MSEEIKKFKMSITYGTASELQKKREEEFMAKDPHDRFVLFLQMIKESNLIFDHKEEKSENFIIRYK